MGSTPFSPKDVWVWVKAAYTMDSRFHARYSALSRCYSYYVGTDDDANSPFRRRYEWRAPGKDLEEGALHQAASMIVGDHAFRGFAVRGTAPAADDHHCLVSSAEWRVREGGYVFVIEANRFLHHMVRFLVGTMLEVALGA